MRKVLFVDGTHLKAKYKGTPLAATTQDGNFHLYPIAFAIVDSENDASWSWFMKCLKTIIPDEKDLVFVYYNKVTERDIFALSLISYNHNTRRNRRTIGCGVISD